MKIGLLYDEIAPGSAPKLIGHPIRELKKLGYEAEAIVIIEKDHGHKAHYDSHLKDVKINYLLPNWFKRINFKFPCMSFFSLHHIMSAFTTIKGFDVIIANCQYATFAARSIKKREGTPFLFLMWDTSVHTAEKIYKKLKWYPLLKMASKWLDRYAIKECSGIITSGKYHHEALRKLTKKPIHVLFPGCFVKENPNFKDRERKILTYDRWDIGNNPVKMLDYLKYVDTGLIIGGFWPEKTKEDFINEVKKRNLENRVEILGVLNEDKIMELCSKVMVHVHPIHEAFGMQSLEAAACGCPIIIPKGSGVTDLFEHEIHGYFPDGDLTEYIRRVISNPKKASKKGRKAYKIAKRNDWEAYAKNLVKIIKETL